MSIEQSGEKPLFSEYYHALGVDAEKTQKLRNYLDERVMNTINSFVHLDSDITSLPILKIYISDNKDSKVGLSGLKGFIKRSSLEKIMDSMLVLKSSKVSRNPIPEYSDETFSGLRHVIRIVDFCIDLNGKRSYVVRKKTGWDHFADKKGTPRKRKTSVTYSLVSNNDLNEPDTKNVYLI